MKIVTKVTQLSSPGWYFPAAPTVALGEGPCGYRRTLTTAMSLSTCQYLACLTGGERKFYIQPSGNCLQNILICLFSLTQLLVLLQNTSLGAIPVCSISPGPS